MPSKSAHVKNEKQYEALKDKGMSKERAAKIANSPDVSQALVGRSRVPAEIPRREAQRHRRRRQGARAVRRPRLSTDLAGNRGWVVTAQHARFCRNLTWVFRASSPVRAGRTEEAPWIPIASRGTSKKLKAS